MNYYFNIISIATYLVKTSSKESSKSRYECNTTVPACCSNCNANHVLFSNKALNMPFREFLNINNNKIVYRKIICLKNIIPL